MECAVGKKEASIADAWMPFSLSSASSRMRTEPSGIE